MDTDVYGRKQQVNESDLFNKQKKVFHLGRYRVTVISESFNVILWNIRPIDSKYSFTDLFGCEIFKIDDF